MSVTRKWLELTGRDERELQRRIQLFGQALTKRRGELLDIKWTRRGANAALCVAVLYQVPVLGVAASVGF